MSLSSVNSVRLNPFSNDTTKVVNKAAEVKTESKSISADQLLIGTKQKVEIQKGVFPSVKGALAGGVAAAGTGMLVGGIIGGSQYVKTGVALGGVLMAVPGAIAGAAVANYTNSKTKGAMAGALAGAVTGAAVAGLKEGNVKLALAGAALGGIAGAMGGLGGSLVAKQK